MINLIYTLVGIDWHMYTTIFPMIKPLISSNGCSQSCRGSKLRFLTVLLFHNFKIFIMDMLNKNTLDISGQIQDTVKFTDDPNTLWKINMEPENHPFFSIENLENELNQTFPLGSICFFSHKFHLFYFCTQTIPGLCSGRGR